VKTILSKKLEILISKKIKKEDLTANLNWIYFIIICNKLQDFLNLASDYSTYHFSSRQSSSFTVAISAHLWPLSSLTGVFFYPSRPQPESGSIDGVAVISTCCRHNDRRTTEMRRMTENR